MGSAEIQFIVIALVIVVDASVLKYMSDRAKTFIKNSAKSKAKITTIEKIGKGKDSYLKISIVFTDQLGVEIVSSVRGGASKNKYNEGAEIDILYLKTDPKIVKMGDFPKTSADLIKVSTFMRPVK